MFLVPLKLFAFLSKRPMVGNCVVCSALSDSGSMRSSSDKGNMVSAGIGSATGLRLAASARHSNAVLSWPDRLTSHMRQDGSRARTEDHPAGLCEAGHGGRRRRRSASRVGLRRGGARGLPWTRPLAHRALGAATEYDAELAARATANLAQTPHVRVVHGDGTRIAFEPADVVYVNAGATRPADAWLDRLKEGGRLILPLTADAFPNRDVRRGAVFRIERHGPEFLARRISGVAIFPCEGGRDEAGERALGAAFDKGGAERVTRLYLRDDLPEDQCWLRAPGWCLAYR